jgi:adenylylsulfate kinase
MIVLFLGQPASGKTTLANAYTKYITKDLFSKGEIYQGDAMKFVKIDGDRWRDITQNKDYSKEGRLRNLKGAFDMALYLEKEGYTPILSFVTPYEELRQHLQNNAQKFVQIYLEYNEDRGRNKNFANDFELPSGKYLLLNTSLESIDECVAKVNEYVNAV